VRYMPGIVGKRDENQLADIGANEFGTFFRTGERAEVKSLRMGTIRPD